MTIGCGCGQSLKWVVPEADSDKALRLREAARDGVDERLAPDVFPVEVGPALTRAERQGRIAPPDGRLVRTPGAAFPVLVACPGCRNR